MKKVFFDFETRSDIDLRRVGLHAYAEHPSTHVLCVGVAVNDLPVVIYKPEEATQLFCDLVAEEDAKFIAHNFSFEFEIWNKVCTKKYGYPRLELRRGECTLAMAYSMGLPGNLEDACLAAGLQEGKDAAGQRIMMQLTKPKSDGTFYEEKDYPEKFKKLYEYCAQDVEAERELYPRLRKLSCEERKVWELDHKINNRGVGVAYRQAQFVHELVEFVKAKLDSEMEKLTSGFVPTCASNAALLTWLNTNGVEIDSVDKASITLLLSKEQPARIKKVLQLRQRASKSSLAKLKSIINSASSDGRIRGTLQYHASHTGRWGGRKIQPQNFPRGNLSDKAVSQFFELIDGYCL